MVFDTLRSHYIIIQRYSYYGGSAKLGTVYYWFHRLESIADLRICHAPSALAPDAISCVYSHTVERLRSLNTKHAGNLHSITG